MLLKLNSVLEHVYRADLTYHWPHLTIQKLFNDFFLAKQRRREYIRRNFGTCPANLSERAFRPFHRSDVAHATLLVCLLQRIG